MAVRSQFSPHITVEDIIKQTLPAGTKVLAGETGLGREVSWAVAQRSRLPAFSPLKGGEIALLSIDSLQQMPGSPSFPQLVRQLAARGVAAIAVIGDVPAGSERLADSLSIPLLSLSEEVSLRELESLISRTVTERRTELYKWEMTLHRQFTRLSVEGGGVQTIVDALAGISGNVAIFEDDITNIQFTGGDIEHLGISLPLTADSNLIDWQKTFDLDAAEPPIWKSLIPDTELARLIAPIVMRRKIVGYLSLIGQADAMDEMQRHALSVAVSACATELARKLAIIEVENRFKGEFIDSLVEGRFPSIDEASTRGQGLGFDASRQYVVATANLDPEKRPKVSTRPDYTVIEKRESEFAIFFCEELSRLNRECLVRAKKDMAIVICPIDSEDPSSIAMIEDTLEKARKLASTRMRGYEGSCGFGRYYPGLKGMATSYHEAQQALSITQSLLGGKRTAYFGSLGAYRLLFPLRDSTELRDFYEETLGKLIEYDQKNGSDLLDTLEAFFTCHGNVEKTAEALYLHRNTLAYRMRRIEQTTGMHLKDLEDSFRLQLALKIRKVIEARISSA